MHLNNGDDGGTFIIVAVVFSLFNFLYSLDLVSLLAVTRQEKGPFACPPSLALCVRSHLTKWTYNWKRPDSTFIFMLEILIRIPFFCAKEKKRINGGKGSCRRKSQSLVLWIIAWKWRERAERQKLQKASILLKGKMSDLLFNYKLMNIFVEKFFKKSKREIF